MKNGQLGEMLTHLETENIFYWLCKTDGLSFFKVLDL